MGIIYGSVIGLMQEEARSLDYSSYLKWDMLRDSAGSLGNYIVGSTRSKW